jgi:hypothetical protein
MILREKMRGLGPDGSVAEDVGGGRSFATQKVRSGPREARAAAVKKKSATS